MRSFVSVTHVRYQASHPDTPGVVYTARCIVPETRYCRILSNNSIALTEFPRITYQHCNQHPSIPSGSSWTKKGRRKETHDHPTRFPHPSTELLVRVIHDEVEEQVEAAEYAGELAAALEVEVESAVHEFWHEYQLECKGGD